MIDKIYKKLTNLISKKEPTKQRAKPSKFNKAFRKNSKEVRDLKKLLNKRFKIK